MLNAFISASTVPAAATGLPIRGVLVLRQDVGQARDGLLPAIEPDALGDPVPRAERAEVFVERRARLPASRREDAVDHEIVHEQPTARLHFSQLPDVAALDR